METKINSISDGRFDIAGVFIYESRWYLAAAEINLYDYDRGYIRYLVDRSRIKSPSQEDCARLVFEDEIWGEIISSHHTEAEAKAALAAYLSSKIGATA